jgi:glycosyltransferase involved in cell wall biosynthesis
MSANGGKPLRVLLITRAPVGGLWRHILDLTDGLLERGFELGIAVDSLRASDHVRSTLERFSPAPSLGVHTLDIPRLPGWGDVRLSMQFRRLIKELQPDVVHGHGAKGGLYARLSAWRTDAHAVYTPHGGSLHYDWKTMSGKVFLTAERRMIPLTDQFLFESQFSADGFEQKIGDTRGRDKVVFNGLGSGEFAGGPVTLDNPTHDFAFVGEMRAIKGVDVLLEALCQMRHPMADHYAC